jgi:hypothetical protein
MDFSQGGHLMDAVSFLRQQLQEAHGLLEGTMENVTAEQAHFAPPGIANPLGASYAHAVMSEDFIINGMLRGSAPLAMSTWAGKIGISEPPPPPTEPWNQWGRQVRIDLSALRQYAQDVYKASDEYLASLNNDALNRPIDLSSFGVGEQTVGWLLSNAVLGHVNGHCGEVSCLKGLQGAKGYPF